MAFEREQGSTAEEILAANPSGRAETTATILQPTEQPGGILRSEGWGAVSSFSAMLAAMAALWSIRQAGRIHETARGDRDLCRSSDLYKQHVLDPVTIELKAFLDRAYGLFAEARRKVDGLDGNSTVDALNLIQKDASDAFTKELSAAWRRIVPHLGSWSAPSLEPEIRRLWEKIDDSVSGEFGKVQIPTDEMGGHVLSGVTAILRAVLHHDPARPDDQN